MVDYMATMEAYHSAMEVTMMDAYDYNSINWNGLTPVLQATLDAEWLGIYKTEVIIALSIDAGNEVINGFESDALGTMHWYDSAPEDQLNLVGSGACGDTMMYSCRTSQGSEKTYVTHNHMQLVQVLKDGRDVKLLILQQFNIKKAAIIAATTKAEVDAI